jgi:hypothetical protein
MLPTASQVVLSPKPSALGSTYGSITRYKVLSFVKVLNSVPKIDPHLSHSLGFIGAKCWPTG